MAIEIRNPGKPAIEYLSKARELLKDRKNWKAGDLGDVMGPNCPLGAISLVAQIFDDKQGFLAYPRDDQNGVRDAIQYLHDAIPVDRFRCDPPEEKWQPEVSVMNMCVWSYNDSGIQHEDVLVWFDKAIEMAKDD